MLKRILMNQVDASPGNSAGAAAADVPAVDVQPQAQGAAATIVMTQADLDATIATAIDKGFTKARDSFHAEARRASTAPKATAKADVAPPVTALDPLKLRSLDRALAKTGLASRLTDSQYQRAEKAFAAEEFENADAFVADYFNGFTAATPVATTPAQPANPAAPKLPSNASPASDRGSPPPSQVPLHEADLRTMSDADRAHLVKEKGLVWYRNQLAKQLKGTTFTTR